MQMDLFLPLPDIPAGSSASGKPLWYDRRRCVWTTNPDDLFLTDEQLIEKYGAAA